MAPLSQIESTPDDVQRLGAPRQLFESSGGKVVSSIMRGLFPMAMAIALAMSAPRWFPGHNWKLYLLWLFAGGMFLAGFRAIIQAVRRRGQKIATFERGFAVWRHNILSTYDWNQVEEIDVSPSFYGFAFHCRNAEGKRKKYAFDAGIDPTEKLRALWREIEEQSSRARIPAVLRSIDAGEEVVFVQKTWGKETGTKIGISQRGMRVTPRYKETMFREWTQIGEVKIEGGWLIVTEEGGRDPWVGESSMAMPGYLAIEAGAEHARRTSAAIAQELRATKLPELLQKVESGEEVVIADFGVSKRELRKGAVTVAWIDVDDLQFDYDSLRLDALPEPIDLDVSELSLENRIQLRAVIESSRPQTAVDRDVGDDANSHENDANQL